MRELLIDLASASYGNRSTPEICDIREIIAAASEAASAAMDNQRIQILLDVPGQIKLPLARSRMKLMFFNLITNALEAMPGGGEVRIGATSSRDYVLVSIEDTGPGIPHEIRDKVFEPFVTARQREWVGTWASPRWNGFFRKSEGLNENKGRSIQEEALRLQRCYRARHGTAGLKVVTSDRKQSDRKR